MSDGEARLIRRVVEGAAGAGPRPWIGPGDDAALTRDGVTVTVDAMIEGVHWDDRLAPDDVGYKLLAVSVSDLASMGARPAWAVLSMSVPREDPGWADHFARGLAEAGRRWGVALVGGDTTRSPGPIALSLTCAGHQVGPPLQRGTARVGDLLWVTGTLGLAGAGWSWPDPPPAALAALRRPDPPLAFALAVARAGLARAAMDLSDGLAADLPRLCAASGVGARLDALPLVDPDPRWRRVALTGGEDYQLLLASPPRHAPALRGLAAATGTRLTCIGACTHPPRIDWGAGDPPTPAFRHFH